MSASRAKRRFVLMVLGVSTAGAVFASGCGDSSSDSGHTAGSAGEAGEQSTSEAGQPGDGGTVGSGAGDTGNAAGQAGTGPSRPAGEDVENFLNDLPNWLQPPPASDMTTPLPAVDRNLSVNGQSETFTCQLVQHDVVADHDQILNFDVGSQYVLPGLILQGDSFSNGELAPIPFAPTKRSPLKLYVNVAGVTDASEIAENPSTSGLTDAIANLQQRAQAAAGDNFAAKVTFDESEVQSMEQLTYSLGVDFSYSSAFTDVGFQAAFAHQEQTEKHTVVMKLQQEMYSVSFAYDEFMRAADFFTDQLTLKDMNGLKTDGYIGPDNLPVFVSDVSYGRMVIFTATSTHSESASQIEQALQVSYNATIGGDTSIDEDAKASAKSTLSTLDIKVLAIGGNSDSVSQAIQGGDWGQLFAKPDILSAVPLRYVVRSLSGNRPVAKLGDTTQFTISECAPKPVLKGWVPVSADDAPAFTDVTSNSTGDAWALGHHGTQYSLYHFDTASGKMLKQSDRDLLDIALDDNGALWAVDGAHRLEHLTAGSQAWAVNSSGYLLDRLECGAAGCQFLGQLYSDGQRDLNFATTFVTGDVASIMHYSLDDAQCISTAHYSFGVGLSSTFWINDWASDALFKCNALYGCGRCDGNYHTAGSGLTQLSVASDTDVWALTNTNSIVQFNGTTGFNAPIAALQPPETPSTIEAGTNTHHWLVSTAGRIFRYVP